MQLSNTHTSMDERTRRTQTTAVLMAQRNQPHKRNFAAEAFRRHHAALHSALAKPDVASRLATRFYNGAIISSETRDVAQMSSFTPKQQADCLLQAVQSSIRTDHTKLRRLTQVLRKLPVLRPIAKQLHQYYRELVSEARLTESPSSGSDTDSTELHHSQALRVSTAAAGTHTASPDIDLQKVEVESDTILDLDDLLDVLKEARDVRSRWYELGVSLRIKVGDLDAVKADKPTSEAGLTAVLKLFLKKVYNVRKFGEPTWRRLVQAVQDPNGGDNPSLAEAISKEHRAAMPHTPTTSGSTGREASMFPTAATSTQAAYPSLQGVREATSGIVSSFPVSTLGSVRGSGNTVLVPQSQNDASSNFPYLDTRELSQEKKLALQCKLLNDSDKIMDEFSNLMHYTIESIVSSCVSVKELHTHLSSLGSYKSIHKQVPLLRDQLDEIKSAENVKDVFNILQDYYSLFNYYILEKLIGWFGTPEDKERLETYIENFKTFCKRMTFECPPDMYSSVNKGKTNFVVKVEESWGPAKGCPIETVLRLRISLGNILGVEPWTLHLCRIDEGCVELMFQVPSFVEEDIFPLSMKQERSLSSVGVTRLTCGKYRFSQPPEAQAPQTSAQTETQKQLCILCYKPTDTMLSPCGHGVMCSECAERTKECPACSVPVESVTQLTADSSKEKSFPKPTDAASIGGSGSALGKPRMEIMEQPKSRGFRFRYDCEGQSHGGLPGENSERNKKQKTYPTVRLIGYRGRARVVVSLVSDTDPPVPHAHSIVGKNAVDGRCILEIGPETDMYAQFPNLGILHVTKKNIPDVLSRRLIQQIQMKDLTMEQLTDQPTNLSEEDVSHIKAEAQSISKTMNLSVVRLCFQAFLMDKQGRFTIPVEPVFTHKVYDSKAPSAGTLKICRMDRTSGSVKGGDYIFLLCDKVHKNDIEVQFYEERHDSGMNPLQPWQAKGRFGQNDVHHQYAIVFQMPPFYNQAIERQVQVFIALRRPSDQELSEPKPFTYLPQKYDEERIGAKPRKRVQHFDQFFGASGGQRSFSGMADIGSSFGSPFGGFFGESGGGTGSSGGGSNQATFGGASSHSAGDPGPYLGWNMGAQLPHPHHQPHHQPLHQVPKLSSTEGFHEAPSAGTLKICRLDRTSGSVKGGDYIFLLCDIVHKNDIEVLFYEERHDSSMNPLQPWQAKGRFGPNDVHHQYAIVFQTPPFYNQAIERQVQVSVALRRPSDQELSEPKPFTYLPQEHDEERVRAKRRRRVQHFDQFFGASGGQGSFGGNFFKDISGSFGSPFGGFFSGSGGGTGSSGGGSNQATFRGASSNSAGPYLGWNMGAQLPHPHHQPHHQPLHQVPKLSSTEGFHEAPSAGTLKICRLDCTSGSVKRGDYIFLLCDIVHKNDIEVLFYEERHDSSMNPLQPWQAKGRFGPNDVHHQFVDETVLSPDCGERSSALDKHNVMVSGLTKKTTDDRMIENSKCPPFVLPSPDLPITSFVTMIQYVLIATSFL